MQLLHIPNADLNFGHNLGSSLRSNGCSHRKTVHSFEFLRVVAFQKCLRLVCAIILSKVINNFVSQGEIFIRGIEVFENSKMLITFDRMMAQKRFFCGVIKIFL